MACSQRDDSTDDEHSENDGARSVGDRLLLRSRIRLPDQPRIGEKLEQYEPREVRRVLVGRYEMRYEVQPSGIFILRVMRNGIVMIGVPGLAYNIFIGAIILGMMALHSWLERRHQDA